MNTSVPFTDRDFVLVCYQGSANLIEAATGALVTNNPVGWPYLPVRYDCQWPATPPKLAVASPLGTGPIDPAVYQNWQLYVQNDPTQPGFNPNDEHALAIPAGGGTAVVALRDDLGTAATSQPYVLITYQDTTGVNRIKVWQVVAPSAGDLATTALAGTQLQPPFPLSVLPLSPGSYASAGPFWKDRTGAFWAMAAGDDGDAAVIVVNYFYEVQPGFYFPSNYFAGTTNAGLRNLPPVGTPVPWLGASAPAGYTYVVSWPNNAPVLNLGDTLIGPKNGLPAVDDPAAPSTSVEILYQQSLHQPAALGPTNVSVMLIDGTGPRQAPLGQLPQGMTTALNGGYYFFPTLPPDLRNRIWYNPISAELTFIGQYVRTDNSGANLPTPYSAAQCPFARPGAVPPGPERRSRMDGSGNQPGRLSTQVTQVAPNTPFNHPLALTTGAGAGVGFVTLAYGYSTNLDQAGDPISLQVIQVACPFVQGAAELIESANPFDESISVRHSSDFGGRPDEYVFQWVYPGSANGLPPASPPADYPATFGSWLYYTNGTGAAEITIAGATPLTLSDNFYSCRYQPANPGSACGTNWSPWTAPQLVPGWITRVLAGTDPLNQDLSTYTTTSNDTIVSMIALAGAPVQGLVPLDTAAAANLGLIELYTTVFSKAPA